MRNLNPTREEITDRINFLSQTSSAVRRHHIIHAKKELIDFCVQYGALLTQVAYRKIDSLEGKSPLHRRIYYGFKTKDGSSLGEYSLREIKETKK